MSYERDKDRFTRGVGAIAALDAGDARRYRERIARARQTQALDRKLSRYTFRPGGGMAQGLGAINLTGMTLGTVRSPGDLLRTDVSQHPTIPLPVPGAGGGAGGGGGGTPPHYGPNTGTAPTRLYGGAGTVLQQPPRSPTGPAGGYVVGYLPGTRTPVTGVIATPGTPVTGVIVDPVRGTVTPVTGGVKTTPGAVTVGGGGGGGGGSGNGISVATPEYPGAEVSVDTGIPDDVGTPASSGMSGAKKALLIGGGVLALWYLFGRKKPGGGSP